MRKNLVLFGCLLAVVAVAAVLLRARQVPDAATPSASASASTVGHAAGPVTPASAAFDRSKLREEFVGSAACVPCHKSQAEAYAKSHHALALVVPALETLKPQLEHASFSTKLGGLTRFSEQSGAFQVTTPNAKGKSTTFPVVYTSGVAPLQQYVVATERGKLQSLGVVWDSRSKADGGERWFHVYGNEGIAPDDSLYFTGSAQNWNHVCADCHSTLVERRYELAADRFDTRWAELSVGCEACHGPGAAHVRAANAGMKHGPIPKTLGGPPWHGSRALALRLRPSEPWTPSSATGSPVPRAPDTVEVEVCAACHSRRQPLHEGFLAGDPFLDAFEPELLRPGRYHADGQVEGEVYEWASFLQSRMYAAGVRCSDCHDPHSSELYAQGNALCARCHTPARFDQETHSHHPGGSGPRCVDCHMPTETFMQIDVRRDHSIRIPRPDHSVEFGTPNACNGCHKDQTAKWALEWVSKWSPNSAKKGHFVEALARDRKGALDAPRALNALAREATAPAIARATALERLGSYPTPKTLETLRVALSSSEPLVVYGAVLGAGTLPLPQRAPLLLPLVAHRLRVVRIAAATALAGLPLAELDTQTRSAVERAFAEVEASFVVGASRPETHVEKSSFELARGRFDEAEGALRAALRLQPCLPEAHLNLADLARERRDEAAAEREIRTALKCAPQNAFAHHALGLWLVRAKKPDAAVASLRKAVELLPTDTRFGYVLAVAIAENGNLPGALEVLEATLKTRPNDQQLLQALLAYRSRAGEVEAAADAKQKLDALLRE